MRVIVIGFDSAIGGALARAFTARGDLVCSTTWRAGSAERNMVKLDLTSFDPDAVPLPRADIAFFCAAITSIAACRENETLARQINVTGPARLARRLVAAGTRVVFLSSSAVFDWRTPHVKADCPPCPVTIYGKLKAETEAAFSAFGVAASILRLTKVLAPEDKLFNGWMDALIQKRPITAFSDHHMAPVTLEDAVKTLMAISDSSQAGVFQVSGARDTSYYEAALHLASRLGADPKYVIEARAAESGMLPQEIIRHSSLDTSRLDALAGWKAPDPCSVIDEVFHSRLAIAAQDRHLEGQPLSKAGVGHG
jgi:dTDP-4-dehydrorhamnose reductase